jgi:hypothetical protein
MTKLNKLITNKKDRATARGLLRKAKARFNDDDFDMGVCTAIAAEEDGPREEKVANIICNEISDRLGPSVCYVTTWLREELGLDYRTQIEPYQNTYRKRWIDSMINELKEKQ